jgi:hypothetical protein
MITRLLMAVPVIGVATASPVEARTPDDGLAIGRVEQIRQQLHVQDGVRVQNGEMACSGRRQLAQWYNFPNWPNWKNWNDWANRRDRR